MVWLIAHVKFVEDVFQQDSLSEKEKEKEKHLN